MSKKYVNFTSEDFAEDSFFIRWVRHPDQESEWFWRSFIKEHPDKAGEIRQARDIIGLLNFKSMSMDETSYTSIRNKFLLSIREELEKEKPARPHGLLRARKAFLGIAAAILVMVVCLVAYRSLHHPSEKSDSVTEAKQQSKADMEERINPRGQKSVLILPDGSKVWLNADSKLTYTKDFNRQNKREVYLEGEAFFNVAHNVSAPFIVRTASSIRIEVLGTSFNVKSYTEDQTVETTLVQGKVSIDKLKEDGQLVGNLILRPNQRAVYFKETNTLNVENVNAGKLSAWRHDHLVFDETPFNEVLTQLERWYDVKIHVEEDDLQCRLTANIQNESLENVLKLLATSHQIEYKISDDEVFIYGSLCLK